jgi:hypothetical protein
MSRAATSEHARASTRRPSARTSPESSASVTKTAGGIEPRVGCDQRASASTPTSRGSARSSETIGW